MSEILIQIDGKEVRAEEGTTVLEAARSVGISIPTLCHHVRDWWKVVVSCIYPVEKNLKVRTRSEKIDRIRKMILELLLAHAPDSVILNEYAEVYGADRNRFEKEPSFCIHCGLCVRYCNEIKKKNAIGFVDRGTKREINFMPEVASRECNNCKECFPLCPTSYLQATFVLAEALSFPSQSVQRK
jgi:bidirectional [NiFe] hydrogenase diaphorase subunit